MLQNDGYKANVSFSNLVLKCPMTFITKMCAETLTLYFKCRFYVSIFLQQLGKLMLHGCGRQWGRKASSLPIPAARAHNIRTQQRP